MIAELAAPDRLPIETTRSTGISANYDALSRQICAAMDVCVR